MTAPNRRVRRMEKIIEKPEVQLTGTDGNAFAIMGKVTRALKKAGYNEEVIKNYRKEAMSGDYDNLLCVSSEYVEIS
jgi:hypothetical protein